MAVSVHRIGLIRVEVRLDTPTDHRMLQDAYSAILKEATADSIVVANDNAITVTVELGRVIVLSYQRPYRPSDGIDQSIR